MRVFVTGASGWIGSAVSQQLLQDGHQVVGLARSEESAATLREQGVQVRRGDLDDLDGLRTAAQDAEAVLHLANKHDFEHPGVSDRAERGAVQTIVDALAGSRRRFLLAAGVAFRAAGGEPLTELDRSPHHGPDSPRGGSENLALDHTGGGVEVVSLRFAPTVHGLGDHGFVAELVARARQRGVSGYPGEGTNRWPAVHRADAARLVSLALDRAPAGSVVHAVAEDGVPTRRIAEAIGAALGLPTTSVDPEDVPTHFGWIGGFFAADLPASSTRTRELLGWTPVGPSLLEDLGAGAYTS